MPRRKALPPRALLDSTVGEKTLQRDVLELAHYLGYLANHNYDSRLSGPDDGLPDVILAGHGRVLFFEFKTEKGRVSASQRKWLSALGMAGANAYILRPSDWSSGRIMGILTGGIT